MPEGVLYVASQPELEALPIAERLKNSAYGGMPIQLGWCSGHNTKLNCLEYHRDSEINIGRNDFILLLAKEEEIENGLLGTESVKAFRVPAGAVVEVYATTLHYAPCSARKGRASVWLLSCPGAQTVLNRTRAPSPGVLRIKPSGPATNGCWLMAKVLRPLRVP